MERLSPCTSTERGVHHPLPHMRLAQCMEEGSMSRQGRTIKGMGRSVVGGEMIVVEHIVPEIGKGDTLLADEGWDEDDVVT